MPPQMFNEELWLSSLVFNDVVEDSAARVEREKPLIYDQMCPKVDADDPEIMMTFKGGGMIADIIAENSEARVDDGGYLEISTLVIPKLKHGRLFDETQIKRLKRLRRNRGDAADERLFFDFQRRAAEDLAFGISQRRNLIAAAALQDKIQYDLYGIKINGGFGKPNDLKVTVNNGWDNPSTAKPLTDISTLRIHAQQAYDVVYDEIIMSLAAFNHLANTDQFADRVSLLLGWEVTRDNLPVDDTNEMLRFAGRLLNMRITIDDAKFTVRKGATKTTDRYLDLTNVLLVDSRMRRDTSMWDFALATPMEADVLDEIPDIANVYEAQSATRPMGFITPTTHNLNPPGYTYWAVQRGFVRYKEPESNAVLKVGDFTA